MNQKTNRSNRSFGRRARQAPPAAARLGVRRCEWIVRWAALIILFGMGFFPACTTDQPDDGGIFLIRVKNSQVTVGEFKRYLEFTDEDLSAEGVNPESQQELLLRRLNQLTEELILKERAAELAITVSEEEIEKAVDDVKADYPEGTFEQALLENAVSYKIWRERLKSRLLMEKVIVEELENKVEITPEDISTYYQAHHTDGQGKVPEGEQNAGQGKSDAMIVRQLRKTKAEEAYKDWIKALQQAYKVEINWEEWKKLTLP
jgi:hypothetical protein